ncbi:DUF3261 domain-containing protein [Shewanella waksmanii]|uniref:DUF3261 domain-containing protein n=1 Tax=Shewanella waksmanii TaxID=213783 RepID=UPI00048ACA9B|nr:DUF3261 domain-containing protein [Shewanella waksmanii]
MPRLNWIAFLLLACIILSGCTTTKVRQTCMPLASGVDYCLAPLSAAVSSDNRTLQVNLDVKGQSHQLLAQLEINAKLATLVGLAPLGNALFTVTYDGQQINSQQNRLLGSEFKAEYLLAMLQLIYWPINDVNQHLQQGHLVSSQDTAGPVRRLYANDSAVAAIEIKYNSSDLSQAQVQLMIADAQFNMTVTPL